MPYGRPKLPYPYSYVTELVQPFAEFFEGDPSSVNGSCNVYVMALSPAEAVQITSALQAGLDLIYPDTWQLLMQKWSQARQFVNQFRYVDCSNNMVDLCELIATCILTEGGPANQAVKDVIGGYLEGDTGGTTEPNTDSLDCVWGGTRGIYDILVDKWSIINAVLETSTDAVEAFTDIFPINLPVLTGDIEESLVTAIQTVIDAGTALFTAYLEQQGTEDKIRCAVFDSICGRGAPYSYASSDYALIRGALYDGQGSLFGPFIDILMASVTYSPTAQAFKFASDECDDDWQEKCSCGNNWSSTWVFNDTNGLQGWSAPFGSLGGSGLDCTYYAPASALLARLTIEIGTPATIETVVFSYDQVKGSSDEPLTSGIRLYSDTYGGNLVDDQRGSLPDGSQLDASYSYVGSVGAFEVTLNPTNRLSGNGGGSGTLRTITITGTGQKPVGWP